MTSVIQDSMRGHTRICTYKSQLVAVKEINKPYVDIKNEQIRQELRIVSLNFSTSIISCLTLWAYLRGALTFRKSSPFKWTVCKEIFIANNTIRQYKNFTVQLDQILCWEKSTHSTNQSTTCSFAFSTAVLIHTFLIFSCQDFQWNYAPWNWSSIKLEVSCLKY